MRKINLLIPLFIIILFSACDLTNQSDQPNLPLIVITFDDADISIYENGLQMMNEYGFAGTNVINSTWIGSRNRMNWDQVEQLEHEFGWETAGHTLHHVNLPECDYETTLYEIEQDWQNLIDHGLDPVTFALPSGHAEPWQFEIISEYYSNIRTSLDIEHKIPLNRTLLGYFAFISEYEASEVEYRILSGIENGEALIIIGFHTLWGNDNGFDFNCQPDKFDQILRFLYENEFTVLPLKDAVEILCN